MVVDVLGLYLWKHIFTTRPSVSVPLVFVSVHAERQIVGISKFRSAVYLSNMAPIAAKLCQNAFWTIPDISFFDVEKKIETSNGRLHPEDGSVRPQTLGKRVSDDPQYLIFRPPPKKFDKIV